VEPNTPSFSYGSRKEEEVASKWELRKERKREFKYYRLTSSGKKQLLTEESQWKRLAAAIARVMWPAGESCW